ncbi:hydrolase [Lithospermum erythrorhizon]|uniref:Xyloglucan endotransglucosylase/hydrolase n=1 Tax=Lithospermum erythrorhizon TaxID=34254 RepID=A0AAV3Q284_LITER
MEFDRNYNITWGKEHVGFDNQGSEVMLSLDEHSGAGFGSKLSYGSGIFQMRMKIPPKDSAGVITTFYLTSFDNAHDELDFEFMGNGEGKPITLQTNVFVDGQGGREQRFYLWFDPTTQFHTYKILWNDHTIVFYVDDTPIRIFKNNTRNGVPYPSKAMQVECSIWNASWAGQTPIDWSHAPYIAHYQGFSINDTCSSICNHQDCSGVQHCSSSEYWWNSKNLWQLDTNQQKKYKYVTTKYMTYDYCTDRERYPNPPIECNFNRFDAI